MGSHRTKIAFAACVAALALAGGAFASGGGSGGTPPPPTASTLAFGSQTLGNGNVGVAYVGFITANGGGGTPYEYRVVAGKLPAGLTLAKVFGVQSTLISGTPQTAGSSAFTVEVRDRSGNTARKAFAITIEPPTPVSLGNPADALNGGAVGSPYLQNLFVGGGAAPYRWAIVAGALPRGLSLSANGSITGTPTTAGTSSFTIRVADQLGQQATRVYSISIA